jgi:small subunit ribosomal protein S6
MRPTLDEASIDSIHKEISEIIESNDGKVLEQGLWQKRKLAYSIDGHKEAIYTITTFEGTPNTPNEIDRVLKISDDVIRHKVLKVES